MSTNTKNGLKKVRKIAGALFFALFMFTNITIAFSDASSLSSGDFEIFGIELRLFEATYADTSGTGHECSAEKTCGTGGKVSCKGTKSCSTINNGVECDGHYSYCY